MARDFLGFSDAFCFIGFITNILYSLTPSIFIYQLKSGVLIKERISIIAILCLYCNGYLYFLTSIFKAELKDIDPLDFCNLIGAYLGFVYLCLFIYHVYFKEEKKKAIIYYVSLIIGSIAYLILVMLVIKKENNFWSYLIKYLGIIFNILENLPLGFNIIYIIKNKISEKYTLFGAFFGLLNTSAWFAWAFYSCFLNKDNKEEDKPYQTLLANTICVFMPLTQFFLFFKFRKYNKDENNNEDDEIGENKDNLDPSKPEIEEIKDNEEIDNKKSEVYEDFL